MKVPFSEEQFLQNFSRYNHSIWPVQLAAILVCLGLAVWSLSKAGAPARIVLASLSGLWLWNGIAYHWLSFSAINPVARVFGALFVAQALVFAYSAVKQRASFRAVADWRSRLGFMIALYAIVFYPLVGLASGHVFPSAPVLGVAPCPTTIFTLGILLMGRPALSRWIYLIPLIWVAIGSSAAMILGMREDYGLAVAGLLALLALAPWPKLSRQNVPARMA